MYDAILENLRYMPKEESLGRYQFNVHLSDDEYMQMDEVEFRARFRERCHHALEINTYSAIGAGIPLRAGQTDLVKRLMSLWVARGLSKDLPEYQYAEKLVFIAEKSISGEAVDLGEFTPDPVTEETEDSVLSIIRDRRSIRQFTDEDVPDDTINKILDTGLWAPHGCNVQSIRYIVVKEKKEPGLFKGSDIPGGPVHLVICQDMRCYRANSFTPERNQLLDAGAAGQNMILAAHALGLGSVWLTFTEAMSERLRLRFNLPDYIRLVTYIDIGYPDETPIAPPRLRLEEIILGDI